MSFLLLPLHEIKQAKMSLTTSRGHVGRSRGIAPLVLRALFDSEWSTSHPACFTFKNKLHCSFSRRPGWSQRWSGRFGDKEHFLIYTGVGNPDLPRAYNSTYTNSVIHKPTSHSYIHIIQHCFEQPQLIHHPHNQLPKIWSLFNLQEPCVPYTGRA